MNEPTVVESGWAVRGRGWATTSEERRGPRRRVGDQRGGRAGKRVARDAKRAADGLPVDRGVSGRPTGRRTILYSRAVSELTPCCAFTTETMLAGGQKRSHGSSLPRGATSEQVVVAKYL